MNLTLEQLRVACEVARVASFSEAGRTMRLSQPAITRTIRAIESTIGTPLFTRTTRKVVLTTDGTQFIAVATEILNSFDNGIRRFNAYQQAESESLSVVALPSLAAGLLPPLVAKFLEQRPQVQVRLLTHAGDEVVETLLRGEADVAVAERPGDHNDLQVISLGSDPMLAAVPIDHPLADQDEVTWAELAKFPFIGLDERTSVRQLSDRGFAQAGIRAAGRVTADSIGSASAIVSQGVGVSAFPRSTLPLVVGRDTRFLKLTSPLVSRELALITTVTPQPSPLVRAFIREVKEHLELWNERD